MKSFSQNKQKSESRIFWKGLKKTILIILEKWHEYFDVVESPFWCEKSRTKEQNTKSINVGILCVYQYRFTSMPRKIIGITIIIYSYFSTFWNFFLHLHRTLIIIYIIIYCRQLGRWASAIVSSGMVKINQNIQDTKSKPRQARALTIISGPYL